MRSQRLRPEGVARFRPTVGSRVEQDVPLGVAANEIGGRQDVLRTRPAMRVYGRLVSGWDVCLEHTDEIVLEQLPMMLRRRDQRVERVRLVRVHGATGVMPHVLVKDWPGSSRMTASPVLNAFGGHVIGSTAMLRLLTSGSGSPVKSIT